MCRTIPCWCPFSIPVSDPDALGTFCLISFHLDATDTYDVYLQNPTARTAAIEKWTEKHTGPLTIPGVNIIGWSRVYLTILFS